MSNIVCSGSRSKYDQYASAKSAGEFLLSAALLADDIKAIYDLIQAGSGALTYFYAVVGVIAASCALQLATIIISIVLLVKRYPNDKTVAPAPVVVHDSKSSSVNMISTIPEEPIVPPDLKQLNDAVTGMTMVIAALHIARNVLTGNLNPETISPTAASDISVGM